MKRQKVAAAGKQHRPAKTRLPAAAATAAAEAVSTKTPPSRTGKHQGPEGRTSPRSAPKNSLTSLLKPIENDDDDFSYFCLLLLKRCCSPTKAPPSRTGKHHGPEGRTSPRIAPKNSLTSLLKPTWSTLKRIIIQQNDFY